MAWVEAVVDQRKRLIQLWERGTTISELARVFGISRPTVYATIRRWDEDGETGLEDRSRAPHSNPRQTDHAVIAALLTLKDRYPDWGADKLVELLSGDGITLSAFTARDILKRNGRVRSRRKRPPIWSPAAPPRVVVPGVGHSMSADHKGAFRLGNGRYCHPLTIADPASRYIFAIDGESATDVRPAIASFGRVFREWGLPEQIITDNGNPFCSARAIGGLTELSKMWIKLGIRHVRIQPGRPQQNGIHERMHRTLKQSTTRPPERTLAAQQRRFTTFRQEFNHVRPHQALGQERPAERVAPYRRPFPERIPPIEYARSADVRMVRTSGEINWKGGMLFVTQVLTGEPVAMVQISEDTWDLYYGPVHLASWDDRSKRFRAPRQVPTSEDLPASTLARPRPTSPESAAPRGVKDVDVDV
jgi:transposase InsO family protein